MGWAHAVGICRQGFKMGRGVNNYNSQAQRGETESVSGPSLWQVATSVSTLWWKTGKIPLCFHYDSNFLIDPYYQLTRAAAAAVDEPLCAVVFSGTGKRYTNPSNLNVITGNEDASAAGWLAFEGFHSCRK